jgi:ATP-dependent NAD(P)H-hydrate dehydratase
MAHIFCSVQSGIPIKSYSPEPIVHPLLLSSEEGTYNADDLNRTTDAILKWVPTLHSFVIGSGLGRDGMVL